MRRFPHRTLVFGAGEACPRPYRSPNASVGARPCLDRVGGRLVLLPAVLLLLLAGGCSARVTGMTSPVAHDYAPEMWQPLVGELRQPFLVGPGYSAAFGHDARITPAQLITRYEELPTDAAEGELVEVRVGVRPEEGADSLAGGRVGLRYAPELDPRFPEFVAREWPAEHVWLPELSDGLVVEQTFLSPYPLLDGVVVRTATFWGDLTPGEGVLGAAGGTVVDSPYDLESIARLEAGLTVTVSGSTEGFAAVALPDGRSGYVELDDFARLPPPERTLDGPLLLELLDEQGIVVRTAEAEQLFDNAHLELRFPALPDSQSARYTLRLTMPNANANHAAALRASSTVTYADGELRVGGLAQAGDLIFRPLYDAVAPLYEADLAELPREGDWVVIESPPALAAGTVAELVLWQTSNPSGWEYGKTQRRAPYGGWLAEAPDGHAETEGAVLFETIYERDVAVSALVRGGVADLRATLAGDGWFALFYGAMLAGAVGLFIVLLRWPAGRVRRMSRGR